MITKFFWDIFNLNNYYFINIYLTFLFFIKLLGRESSEDGFVVAARRIVDLINKALENLKKESIEYDLKAVVNHI